MSNKKHSNGHNSNNSTKKLYEEVTGSAPVSTSNPLDILDNNVAAPDTTIIGVDEANKPTLENQSFSFFSRVLSIPLIRDGSSMAQSYANQYTLSRFALNQAESTLKLAASIASPYADRVKPQLLKVDELGCKSLELVQSKFPVITEEPREIFTTVKQQPTRVYEDVKGKITQAVAVPVVQVADGIEKLVNKYLPLAEEHTKEKQANKQDANNNNNDETATRLLYLANEVKERLAYRVKSLPHSKADITTRLNETNHLLQEAFLSIQKANTRLYDYIQSVRGGYAHMANQRIHELTIDLIKRLDSAAAYVKEHQANLPTPLQIVVDPLVTFASNEYEIVKTQVLNSDLAPMQKATNIMHLTQEYVLPLIQSSLHGVQVQVRQYSEYANNSKVVKDVRSTFGLVSAKA